MNNNLPEWATKPLGEMTEADKAAWDAWDPTEEEALAVSHAVCERTRNNLAADGYSIEVSSGAVEDMRK